MAAEDVAAYVRDMNLDRLFNALVLEGALLAAACDVEPEPGAPPEATGDETDAPVETTTTGSGDGATSDATSSGSEGSTGGEGSTGEGTTGGSSESEGSTGAPLECSDPPNAADPCGCPCCWILECVNTEECCEGWSECVGS